MDIRECANEQILRRHALATSHWQRHIRYYLSDIRSAGMCRDSSNPAPKIRKRILERPECGRLRTGHVRVPSAEDFDS